MRDQDIKLWAYSPNTEDDDSYEEESIMRNADELILLECAADPDCPKAELIEYYLCDSIRNVTLHRSERALEYIKKINCAVEMLPSNQFNHLREALQVSKLWLNPQKLTSEECTSLAKNLLGWSDSPWNAFYQTGHYFGKFIEYSNHNSSTGLVFIYINPQTGEWDYRGSNRRPVLALSKQSS